MKQTIVQFLSSPQFKEKQVYLSVLAAHLALIGAQLAWAGGLVLVKQSLVAIPPLFNVLVRLAVSPPILFILSRIFERSSPVVPKQKTMLAKVFGVAFVGLCVAQLFSVYGLFMSSATTSSVISCMTPVFATVLCVILRQERATWLKFVGLVICIGGSVAMINFDNFSSGSKSTELWGILLLLGNSLSFAIYQCLQKPLLQHITPVVFTAWSFTFGAAVFAVICLVSLAWTPIEDIIAIPLMSWVPAIGSGLLGMVVGYSLNTWGIARTGVMIASIYGALYPLVVGLLAAVFLGETIDWRLAVGGSLIWLGLAFVLFGKYREYKKASTPPPRSESTVALCDLARSISTVDDFSVYNVSDPNSEECEAPTTPLVVVDSLAIDDMTQAMSMQDDIELEETKKEEELSMPIAAPTETILAAASPLEAAPASKALL